MGAKVLVRFNEADVEYLLTHLTEEELRKEIRHAEVEHGVARSFGDNYDFNWWREYAEVCQTALKRLLPNQPKVSEGQFSVKATKAQHDIVDVIGRYTKLRKSGNSQFYGSCPFHKDTQPSLGVNCEKQVFHCFSCQRSGDVINFIMEIEDLDTKEACLLLER
jgi:hypothetical protein